MLDHSIRWTEKVWGNRRRLWGLHRRMAWIAQHENRGNQSVPNLPCSRFEGGQEGMSRSPGGNYFIFRRPP